MIQQMRFVRLMGMTLQKFRQSRVTLGSSEAILEDHELCGCPITPNTDLIIAMVEINKKYTKGTRKILAWHIILY